MEDSVKNSLLTLNIEANNTNVNFFSNRNIEYIQKQLILQTKKYTGYTISNQSCSGILSAMQYYYINYPQYTLDQNYNLNIENLNILVVNDLTTQTVSGVKQHMEYLKYIKKTPEPLQYGSSTNIKRSNSLQQSDFSL